MHRYDLHKDAHCMAEASWFALSLRKWDLLKRRMLMMMMRMMMMLQLVFVGVSGGY